MLGGLSRGLRSPVHISRPFQPDLFPRPHPACPSQIPFLPSSFSRKLSKLPKKERNGDPIQALKYPPPPDADPEVSAQSSDFSLDELPEDIASIPTYTSPPGFFERFLMKLFPQSQTGLKPQLSHDSTAAVKFALTGNLVNTSVKFLAWFWTGSSTMLSEALHSCADVANQSLLLVGINRASRPPTQDHPYGFDGERFVYALFSAVGIFFIGAGASLLHGITHILHPGELENIWIALGILGISFGIESSTFLRGCAAVYRSARELQMSFTEYVKKGPDPMGVAVILEDGAALLGILIASVCLGFAYMGYPIMDAVGSILIGNLLGAISIFLIRKNTKALLGHSTPPARRQKIVKYVLRDPMVHSIHHVKSVQLGVDSISFNADIEFEGKAVASKYLQKHPEIVEGIILAKGDKTAVEDYLIEYGAFVVAGMGDEVDRIESGLKTDFPDVKHVGLESN